MLTALMLLIKEKLFSTAGIFLLIFAAIFAVFIFSNSNVILSKFGFETTTTLKAEVTRLDGELKTLKDINEKLNKTIADQTAVHDAKLKGVIENFKEQEKARLTVTVIKTKKEIKDRDTIKELEKKTVQTDTEITMPLAELNKLSESNITSLNDAYSSLFETGKTT